MKQKRGGPPERIGSALDRLVAEMAHRHYDPDRDRRLVGGGGYDLIGCQMCEDEGIVFFSAPGRKGPSSARCTCPTGTQALPTTIRFRRGRKLEEVGEVKCWREVEPTLTEADLIPLRLRPFIDAECRLHLGELEPRHVKYRKRGPLATEPGDKRRRS
jgi:hypothetical protein